MATWRLSDGTTVATGGKVTGSSALAETLRDRVSFLKAGGPESVIVAPPPGTSETLDLSDDWHIDCWIREYATRHGATIVEGPKLEMPAYLETDDALNDDDDIH